jgi:rhodanese-related sulfurtransferase
MGSFNKGVRRMNISPKELKRKLDARSEGKEKFLLLDVRNPNEQEVAIISGTDILIPLGELEQDIHKLDEYKENEIEIVVYCRSGGRSTTAVGKLKRLGFLKVLNLEGGILSYSDQIDPAIAKY